MRWAPGAVAIGVVAILSSCGDPTAPPDQGFSITVTGDVSDAIDGMGAVFDEVSVTSTADGVWTIDLSVGEPGSVEGVAFLFNGPRPAAGTYDLADASGGVPDAGRFFAAVTVIVEQPTPASFLGTSTTGTLTITESSGDVVRGEFSFEADGVLFRPTGNTDGVVTVEGTFVAASGEIDLDPPGGPVIVP